KLYAVDFFRVLGDIYVQLGNFKDAASAYQDGIVIAESSLATLTSPSKRLQWTNKTEDLYKGLTRVLILQNEAEDAWKLWEWYKSRSMMAGKGLTANAPAAKLTWTALQQQIRQTVILPDQAARLVYVTFEDGIEAWSI